LQDLSLNRFARYSATLPAFSAPPPFGAATEPMVVRVDPQKLEPITFPSMSWSMRFATQHDQRFGYARIGNMLPICRSIPIVTQYHRLKRFPIHPGQYPAGDFVADIATIEDNTDIPTGFAR